MVRDFPRFPTGHLQLGMEYFKKGDVINARRALQTGFENGLQDARGYHYMGLCYFNDWKRARPYYEESIRQFPYYALSYVGLGRIYVLSGHYAQAIPYLEKALALAPSYTGYGYLIQAYIRTDRPDDALAVYQQAKNNLREKSRLDSLEKFIQEGSNLRGSVDIGI
jgi:tetratricopeptide (TPR) repeat protein